MTNQHTDEMREAKREYDLIRLSYSNGVSEATARYQDALREAREVILKMPAENQYMGDKILATIEKLLGDKT